MYSSKKFLRVGLIGCGAIGSEILQFFDKRFFDKIRIVAILDRDLEKTRHIIEKLHNQRPLPVTNIQELIREKPKLVIEAASPDAVKQYVVQLLAKNIDVLVLSVSALLDRNMLENIIRICKRVGARLLIPSGAIGGIDILRAHALAGLREVVLETRKNPRALGMYVSEPEVVYEGDIINAISKFPRNLNVYMTVLLSIEWQYEKVKCRVVADPGISKNVHYIYVRSDIGEAEIKIVNEPSPINPRTSRVAAFSVIAKILNYYIQEIHL